MWSLSQLLSARGADVLWLTLSAVLHADSFICLHTSVTPRVSATGLHSGSLELAPVNASSSSSITVLTGMWLLSGILTGRSGCMNGGLWARSSTCFLHSWCHWTVFIVLSRGVPFDCSLVALPLVSLRFALQSTLTCSWCTWFILSNDMVNTCLQISLSWPIPGHPSLTFV